MALSSLALNPLARKALADESGVMPGSATYDHGFRTYHNIADDPMAIRYRQFADEARAHGITDPYAVDQYAISRNQQWGQENGIQNTDINRGKLGVAAIGLGGYGAAALGGEAAGGAAAAGEGAGYVAGPEDAALTGGGGGAGGSLGTGALEGGGVSDVYPGSGANVVGDTGSAGGSGTALSRILDGSATTADWLSVGGNLGSTGLGILGSRNAARGFGDLSGQYLAMGAPSRARYEASMSPGFDPTTIPGYSGAMDSASRGLLARLAASGGNPYGNPGGLVEANRQLVTGTAMPIIDAYQRMNAGTGGYAGFNAAAPGMAANQIGAQGGVYNAVGSGLAGLLNQQPSLLDTLRGLNMSGLN